MDPTASTNGAPPAATGKKGKNKKNADPVNTSKQIEDAIAALEKTKQGDAEAEAEIEREVRRANREVKTMLERFESPMHKLDALQKRFTGLLTDMKRVERENAKSKKRADTLQKERDKAQTDLAKKNTMNEKLEKLSRELQRDYKKVKVGIHEQQRLYHRLIGY